jgi:hypothetical protein
MPPRRALSIVAIAGALLVTACGGSAPQVTWNLRDSHTKADVGWKDSLDATSLSQTVDVTILLPGDHSATIMAVREDFQASGDQLTAVAVLYPPATNDEGYKQAKSVAGQWGLSTAALDEWHQEILQARQHGQPESQVPYFREMVGVPLADGGPIPVATIIQSSDDGKPFQLRLEFQWT